ncbi:flagellar biosynthetic protein FliR [Paenibacillus sp. y28]|uniref:flagellar biosynthetic protein FliR n=1 Tax=Paenibacillus sp. y28 TaxID=3129110 RepID=UPI003019661B
MDLILQYLPTFMLVFCRITAFFVVSPIFSYAHAPAQFRIGLAVFVSFIAFSTLPVTNPVPIDGIFFLSVLREVIVGLALGFVVYMFFQAVQVAGVFVDTQIGFGMANVIDPMTGTQSPLLGNLKMIVSTLLFLAMNGHHYLLRALIDSYQWVPVTNEAFSQIYNGSVSTFISRSFASMFSLAFQIAAPMVVTLFLVDIGLGLLARTAPQFNVFVIGIPLKILVGLIVLAFLMPEYLSLFQTVFTSAIESMHQLTTIFGNQP